MPGSDIYTVSAMTLKKNAHGYQITTTNIYAVQFQFSTDNGNTWEDHEDGKWFPTTMIPTDGKNKERKFAINPPMNGNAFRVKLDHQDGHIVGPSTNGRFDLWAIKNEEATDAAETAETAEAAKMKA